MLTGEITIEVKVRLTYIIINTYQCTRYLVHVWTLTVITIPSSKVSLFFHKWRRYATKWYWLTTGFREWHQSSYLCERYWVTDCLVKTAHGKTVVNQDTIFLWLKIFYKNQCLKKYFTVLTISCSNSVIASSPSLKMQRTEMGSWPISCPSGSIV